MISLSSLQAFEGCNPIFTRDEREDESLFLMKAIVKVTIKLSNIHSHELVIPGHLLVAREEEMRQIKADTIHSNYSDWSGSLIMKKILKKKPTLAPSTHNNDIFISLNPEDSTISPPDVVWSSTLKLCIEKFYSTGVIPIFDRCPTRDIIMMLKFLGIMYTQNHLTFESFGTYLNFKLWSDYYNYREIIATWIKESLISYHSQHSYIYVTHPDRLENASFYFQGSKCEHLDGGLDLLSLNSDEMKTTVNSCTGEVKMIFFAFLKE